SFRETTQDRLGPPWAGAVAWKYFNLFLIWDERNVNGGTTARSSRPEILFKTHEYFYHTRTTAFGNPLCLECWPAPPVARRGSCVRCCFSGCPCSSCGHSYTD